MLWTKGGTKKHPVIWVAGKFSEGFHEFCFKAKFVFCFQFEHFTIKKDQWLCKIYLLIKNVVAAYMAPKCLALSELKMASVPGLIPSVIAVK